MPTDQVLAAALDAEHCYPALQARDARFDGHWFVGVSSTGIYCRPICRVRTPKRENCTFFAYASQAEGAGYRPCMKCRPELAPRALQPVWSAMDASATLAHQAADALGTIASQAGDAPASESAVTEAVAARLGISSRHLRRIFAATFGVSPLQYLQTQRLLLAKALLTDTTLPVLDVALASGFKSLRRFNDAFVHQYRMPPTRLRAMTDRLPDAAIPATPQILRLDYRPPFNAQALLEFFSARAIPGVETVDLRALMVTRSLSVGSGTRTCSGWISARFPSDRPQVHLSLSDSLWPVVAQVLRLIRGWLDLDAEPEAIAASLKPLASPDAPPAAALRLPGCTDRFELAVRAVLGQQVTVAAARTLSTRFVQRFGTPLDTQADGVNLLFPSPARITNASVDEIAELGIIRRRAECLRAIASEWSSLRYAQNHAQSQADVDAAMAELQTLPGLGPWTAQYMLMRGWSWPDLFPPGDVVLQKQLSPPGQKLTPAQVARMAESLRPYRSYAVLHLWRQAAAPTS